MTRSPSIVLVSLVLLSNSAACGGGGGGGGGGGNTDNWPSANAAFEADLLELVNDRRAEGATCGGEAFGPTDPLTKDDLLNEAARGHSLDMVERDFFDHTNPDGDSPGDRIDDLGYEWSTWGENIAAGQSTPAAVMQTWMNSPGHCSNIMNPAFDEIGLGYYEGHWTQVFGTPR